VLALCAPALLIALGASQLAAGGWIHAKARLAQFLLERAWQQTIAGGRRVRPWPWADTWPVARLVIPGRDTSLIVLAGSSGRTLAFGPGHTQGSAPPGAAGTAIVSGHRDTHFAVLRDLRLGDELLVERPDGEVVRYRVEDLQIADSRSAKLRAETSDRVLLLVTCWPFDALVPGGPLRYVVTTRESRGPGPGRAVWSRPGQSPGHPLRSAAPRCARFALAG
jgi:sortase A